MKEENRQENTACKILVVDDEPAITDAIAYILKRSLYTVETAYDGDQALKKIETFKPEILVLDVMMPKYDGYQICKKVRKIQTMGIIMLTAKSELEDKVLGLELGADDYITKPFEMTELLARIRALSRRVGGGNKSQEECDLKRYRVREVEVRCKEREVYIKGQVVFFKPKEFELLLFLLKNPMHVFSRQELIDKVWGIDYLGTHRTVDIHIQRIRQKLGENAELIETVPRVGYRAVEGID